MTTAGLDGPLRVVTGCPVVAVDTGASVPAYEDMGSQWWVCPG